MILELGGKCGGTKYEVMMTFSACQYSVGVASTGLDDWIA